MDSYVQAITGDRKKPKDLSLSADGKSFIKTWEGVSCDGYWDSEGYLTIGIGELLYDKVSRTKIKRKDQTQKVNCKEVIDRVKRDYIDTDSNGNQVVRISEEVAETKFNDHIDIFEKKVRALNVDFYQWEFDAMVSLFFNMGSLEKAPTLESHLNSGKYTNAGKEFNDITNSDKSGLVYRRAAEMDMFLRSEERRVGKEC